VGEKEENQDTKEEVEEVLANQEPEQVGKGDEGEEDSEGEEYPGEERDQERVLETEAEDGIGIGDAQDDDFESPEGQQAAMGIGIGGDWVGLEAMSENEVEGGGEEVGEAEEDNQGDKGDEEGAREGGGHRAESKARDGWCTERLAGEEEDVGTRGRRGGMR
jgi:hypothetical protein